VYPQFVSIVVAGVLSLLVVHAMLAAQVPDRLPTVPRVPRSRQRHEAWRHHALVVAGRVRLRDVLLARSTCT
jgi:hypothetical protein